MRLKLQFAGVFIQTIQISTDTLGFLRLKFLHWHVNSLRSLHYEYKFFIIATTVMHPGLAYKRIHS